MSILRIKKYWLALIVLSAMASLFLPTNSADACILSTDPITNCIKTGVASLLWLVFSITGKIIGVLAVALNAVIYMRVFPDEGIPVVAASWKIMRDFANMFFIVALIMMAFATIFNISKYEARTLFPKFLVSALLINFSMVIGVLIINASQVLSNVFLTAIGDMANRLGETMVAHIDDLVPTQGALAQVSGAGVGQTVFTAIVQLIFSVILFFSFLFSLLTALLFAIIRIPILWALLVVSPIIWILNVFPAGQGTYKKWWSTFIGWNMFLPIFLFFLYFSLLFLQDQGEVMTSIALGTKDQQLLEGVKMPIQVIFYYALASIFLIGGTITAMKASMFGGYGVVGVAQWSGGLVKRRLGLTAAGQAWQEKKAQIQGGEGRLGRVFGGPAPGLGTARSLLGVRGADFKTQKDFVDRAGKEYETLEAQYNTGKVSLDQITSQAGKLSASTPQGFAYRKFAAKMGRLDQRTFESTLKGLANNPYAAQDFIKTAKEAKFASVPPDQIINAAAGTGAYSDLGPNALPARRELYKHIQSDGRMLSSSNFTAREFDTGIQLLGGDTSAEGGAYLRDVSKVRPDLVANYHLSTEERRNKLAAMSGGVLPSRDQLIERSLSDPKDIAGMPKDVWNDPDFQAALERKLNFGSPKAQQNFRNRLYDNLRSAFNSDDKRAILDRMTGGRGPTGGTGGTGGGGTPPAGGGGTPPPIGPGPTGSPAPRPPRPPQGVNPGNVVDLRQGERQSPGGIILTPGAQFEMEREENNQ